MERQADTEEAGSLERELDVWRKTPFGVLLGRRPAFRPSALISAIATADGTPTDQVRLEDIRAMLISVVAAAETTIPMTLPDSAAGSISNPATLRLIFGLTDKSKEANARQRQEFAASTVTSKPSWHTIRGFNSAYVDQFASWIRLYQLRMQDPKPGDRAPAAPWIPRSEDLAWLRRTYRELAADEGGLFVIWGLDGVGKSTLARRFADQVGPPQISQIIRLRRRGLYERDIRQVLLREGIDDGPLSDEQCIARFRDLATRFKAIRLLVLDDVRAEEDIHMLLPRGTNIPVLITASTRLSFGDQDDRTPPPSRLIATVPDDDVQTYLREQLEQVSTLTEKTLDGLTSVLGGHAETLHLVVRYLKSDDAMSPEDLLEDIARRTRHALNDLAELGQAARSLPVIVQELYEAVRNVPLATGILATIVWMHSSGERPRDLVVEIVRHLAGRPSLMQLQAAVHRLERLGLVMQTETSLAVPRLTARILRDFLLDERSAVLLAYERAVAEPPAEDDHWSLLEVLRQEYVCLEPLRNSFAATLDNTHTPLPAVLGLDDSTWAVFSTDDNRDRRVDLYRLTPKEILYLSNDDTQWASTTAEEVDFIVNLTADIYPTIKDRAVKRQDD
ncbi:MAG TPA: ATP-binding protein [Actinophytocola sp.]|uniref:ATP-binding protein n=1 Tax=Actinophytocola sp. TaxID=1872138 RepID=UPI002DBA2CBB|nr:ATP-binding protein [Actinophytocola sp.]HEU5473778.1 ATP-binding protein [Actinophytocola sp.]